MELTELLNNPDYVNANTATRKAIFEKYSKNNKDYVSANDETRQAIHQRFGLGGVNVTEPLPEKITDFSGRDFGNMLKQSFSQANAEIAKTGRTPVVGPAVLGAVGETIKGLGAIGELATDRAQGITKVGQAITQGAQEANMPAATVGQVGSYIAPYKLAQSGIQATAGRVPYLRGAVNPATMVGSTGEMAAAGALVGGLTTPGGYDERMNEAQLQALMGGGANAAIRGGIGAYQTGKGLYQGGRNAIDQRFGNPNARTAFTEVGEQVYPSSTANPFTKLTPEEQVKQLSALEASQVPTPSLFKTYPQKFAYNLAETGPTGGKLIPNQGASLAEAFGEQTMRNFQKPITDLSGIGGNLAGAAAGALTGSAFGPLGALVGGAGGFVAPQIKRGLELWKLSQLQGAANLNPNFARQLQQAQQTAGRLGLEGSLPQTPLLGYTPRSGGSGGSGGGTGGNPTMYVGPTGTATTNLAGTQVNMNPGTFGQTPVAQAAQATTQRIASAAPRAPRVAPQPRAEFKMPSVEESYNNSLNSVPEWQRKQGWVVSEVALKNRTDEVLKEARQQGRTLTKEQAENIADNELRQFRNNLSKTEKKSDIGPTATQPGEPPKTITRGFEKIGSTDPAIDYDRNLWLGLQAKVQRGEALKSYEQTQANSLTKKYGPDPFGSGDLQGKKLFNTQAPGENKVTPAVETPKVETPTTNFANAKQVRSAMSQSAKAGITIKNGKIQIDEAIFNDGAEVMGLPKPDFSKMPNVKNMGLAEARKAIETEIDRQYKTANVYSKTTRGPTQATLVKEERAKMTPEELKAQDEAAVARMDKLNQYLKTGKISSGTTTPTTPPVASPVRPEGAVDAPKMTNAELLELIKARSNKGKAPPGVMEMKTGKKSSGNPIDDAPWLTPEEFNNEVFMNTLGKNAGEEFIAKTKTADGSLIKVINKDMDVESIKYNDGSSFYRKNLKSSDGSDITIFNKDGTEYSIIKRPNYIENILIYDKDKTIIAEYNYDPLTKSTGKWWVKENTPDGGGMMIDKKDIGISKDPYTRKLHKELPKVDFDALVKEQLARAEDLKKVK